MDATSRGTASDDGSPPDEPVLDARLGQYEIIRLLGRGGMGQVHLARDLRLGRLVAVKTLSTRHPDLDVRFLAEARATARCRHENIVVIHEVGAHRGRPYMVLEYLEGQTLRQWLDDPATSAGRAAGVPLGRAIELMLPVVRALAYAHGQGIVHRDLKPENVMLTRDGAIKVLDFGVAKLLSSPAEPGATADARASSNSTTAGTRLYMAPEQRALEAIDHRADLWAAGVMLFELLAGAHPLQGAARSTAIDTGAPMPRASERLPELGPLADVIDRCLIRDPAHRTASAQVLLAELEALAPGRPAVADATPFAGLAAFQESDAGRFFGRDRDIEHVVAELRRRPLVAVVGPSGAGKSSLVRAGVIPALKRSGEGWDAHVVRPGRDPVSALAAIAAQLDLRAEPGALGAHLRIHAASTGRRVVVFVDQLEELYTLGAPAGDRSQFLACLAAIADDAASRLRVLVSMRSDFLDRLTEDRQLGAEITRGLVLLPAMDRDGLRDALVRPVEARDHCFDPPALVDRMIDAIAGTRGTLPLLQFTAARLWERRDRERRRLTEAAYDELGGVAGALAMHADAVVAGMPAAQQSLARAVLERLVTPERTRALVSMRELRELQAPRPDLVDLVDDVVQHLAAMRLVVIERADAGDHTVELVHESLIDRWTTLARWLDDNKGDAAMLARLRAAAREWERSGRAPGLLWTGEVAHAARAWRQRQRGELAPPEQRYLAALVAAADRARRARQRLFATILTAAMLTAVAMAWLAWQQTASRRAAVALAATAAQEAMRARDATRTAAMRALPGDPTAQLALLREIEDLDDPPPGAAQAAQALLHAAVARIVWTVPEEPSCAAFSPDGQRVASGAADGAIRVWSADGRGEPLVVRGHDATVTAVAFSPDGGRMVSSSGDRTVRVWRAAGEPVILRGHNAVVTAAAFSPDGLRIASASEDRTVRVWRADGRGEPLVLAGHGAVVTSVAFSPDGQRLASASSDGTVRVWRADGRGEPLVLGGHRDAVTSAAFSPDGLRLVSASADKTVRVWRTDGSGEPLVLRGHDKRVSSVAFSPDGRRIVSASWDKTVRIWSADGLGEPVVLQGHDERVLSAAFSPDGERIVSAALDRTVRVWSLAQTREPPVLRGHDDAVSWLAFSPDGERIASASSDRTVRIERRDGLGEPIVLRGHDAIVSAVEFSPDGQRVVTASYDNTVRVWRADGSGAPLILRGHINVVRSAAFSPDGRRLVSASADMTVRVWNADGSGEPLILRGHTHTVDSAMFSPDGRRIVSASWDRTVRIWNADGSGQPIVLHGHDGLVRGAMFSPDGQRVVSAGTDHTVRVWNADGSGEPRILRGHTDWVLWAEFSPDGQRVASASRDKTIRIWPGDGGAPVVLTGHELSVTQVRFSPDGRRLVSGSLDHTLRLWYDLGPASLADPRLWAATSYCMPVERRIDLLHMPRSQAERDLRRCTDRVERRLSSTAPR